MKKITIIPFNQLQLISGGTDLHETIHADSKKLGPYPSEPGPTGCTSIGKLSICPNISINDNASAGLFKFDYALTKNLNVYGGMGFAKPHGGSAAQSYLGGFTYSF